MGQRTKKRLYCVGRIAFLACFLLSACAAFMTKVEEPKYKVTHAQGDMEIRDYSPMIVAETIVESEESEAMSNGFRILADYLFGNNSEGKKMTMTAPVTRQGAAKGKWAVRFFMPSEYRLNNLPKPTEANVRIKTIPYTKVAAIRFSGLVLERTLDEKTAKLKDYIHSKGMVEQENPILARYDPPWTLPFLRRNEILLPIR